MQLHFDFADWEMAFETFYRRRCGEVVKDLTGKVLGARAGDSDLVFIVCTSPYASGYWLESGQSKLEVKADSKTKVYRTVKQVRALERRVREERSKTVNLSLDGVVL